MTLQRPASLTDDFLQQLVARVPSSDGGTWKLTEVYTGELLVELPQSTAGRHRAGLRDRARGAGRVGRAAAEEAARGLQARAHALPRQRRDHHRPDPGRERQEPPDGDRGDLRPADGDEPLPQAGAQAARAGQARRAGPVPHDVDRDPPAQGRRRDHRAVELPVRDRHLRLDLGADGRQRDRAQARQQDRAVAALRHPAARGGRAAEGPLPGRLRRGPRRRARR